MHTLVFILGLFLIVAILVEGFETVVLPRSVMRKVRFSRYFNIYTWKFWTAIAPKPGPDSRRDLHLSMFGPASLLGLLSCWAVGLIAGFGLMHWGLGSQLNTADHPKSIRTDLYFSGTTFLTLGLGDVVPTPPIARLLTILEAGCGFGFLALVISYLPVLYASFSTREAAIALLDGRASSPPTAGELIRRYLEANDLQSLTSLLASWELWAAQVLESHLSYPILAYYRSQHDHQSWLGATATMMDTCALIIVGIDREDKEHAALRWQAELTYAMSRHAIIDIAAVFNTPPQTPEPNRMPTEDLKLLKQRIQEAGGPLKLTETAELRLEKLRKRYEPYIYSLSQRFHVELPPWIVHQPTVDNWQTSAWEHELPGAMHKL